MNPKTTGGKEQNTNDEQAGEKRVTQEGSVEDIATFYDSTDTGDFDWSEDEPENQAVAGRPELEQVSVRLPKEDVEALKRRAKKSGVGYTTILRMIVHEYVNSPLMR